MHFREETTPVNYDYNGLLPSVELPFRITSFTYRSVKKYSRDGHWNEKERLKYTVFVKYFRSTLEDQEKKWSIRIYDMMADMICTRNSSQCRSHHQKMLKFNVTIPAIISGVTGKYEPRIYEEIQQKYSVLIKGLLEHLQRYKRRSPYSEDNTKTYSPIKVFIKKQEGVNSLGSSPIFHQVREHRKLVETKIGTEEGEDKDNEKDKEDNRKTAMEYDVYEEQQEYAEQEQQPEISPKGFIRVFDSLPMQPQLPSNLGNGMSPPLLSSQLQFPLCLGREGKLYYSKQIQTIEAQKQWHCQNAQNLYAQWQSQLEAMRLCEETIHFYRRGVAEQ